MNIDLIKNAAVDVLRNIPSKAFLCLPMSATFYAMLKDKHQIDAKLVTGNLLYKGDYVFKQDFSLKSADGTFKEWAGHAWVEVDDFVWDLSFCRTLYSQQFSKPYRAELIQMLGEGRGILAGEKLTFLQGYSLYYDAVETLEDDMATAIICGMEFLI